MAFSRILASIVLATGCLAQNAFTPVTSQVLAEPDPADWLMWRRTLNSWGFSPLNQINTKNVKQMQLAFVRGLPPGEYFVAVTRDADESDLTNTDLLDRLSRQAQLIRLADGERRSLPLTAPDPRRRLAGRH